MKLSLFEQTDPTSIVTDLTSHCMPFISSGGGRTFELIRGEHTRDEYLQNVQVRQDREPFDSYNFFHEAYNRYFKEKFGIDNLRSSCVFLFCRSY